jgi:hypothetical protein
LATTRYFNVHMTVLYACEEIPRFSVIWALLENVSFGTHICNHWGVTTCFPVYEAKKNFEDVSCSRCLLCTDLKQNVFINSLGNISNPCRRSWDEVGNLQAL